MFKSRTHVFMDQKWSSHVKALIELKLGMCVQSRDSSEEFDSLGVWGARGAPVRPESTQVQRLDV